jgi:hypothetical protein
VQARARSIGPEPSHSYFDVVVQGYEITLAALRHPCGMVSEAQAAARADAGVFGLRFHASHQRCMTSPQRTGQMVQIGAGLQQLAARRYPGRGHLCPPLSPLQGLYCVRRATWCDFSPLVAGLRLGNAAALRLASRRPALASDTFNDCRGHAQLADARCRRRPCACRRRKRRASAPSGSLPSAGSTSSSFSSSSSMISSSFSTLARAASARLPFPALSPSVSWPQGPAASRGHRSGQCAPPVGSCVRYKS